MAKFNPKLLTMLSPDADDWDNLMDRSWRNLENMVEGVLLYPKGISKEKLTLEVEGWISAQHSMEHGHVDIHKVVRRSENWAIVYSISAWYNHFNLLEEYD
jgi:hypothetical protein